MFNTISKILAVLLLAGILLERLGYATAQDVRPFHAAVHKAVEQVPQAFNTWKGVPVPVPAPARKLLRPSTMLAREYTDIARNISATLVIIHCPDTRDLAGHYPDRCYPSMGWGRVGETQEVSFGVAGTTVPMRRYEFVKHSLEMETRQVVFGTFLIPGSGIAPSMEAVYERAADYRTRLYGATQIQIIFGDGFPKHEEQRVVTDFLENTWPVISIVKNKNTGS